MSILFAPGRLALLVLVAACPVLSVYTTHTLFWYLDYGGDTIKFPSGQIDMAGQGIMGLTMDATAQVKAPLHIPSPLCPLPIPSPLVHTTNCPRC